MPGGDRRSRGKALQADPWAALSLTLLIPAPKGAPSGTREDLSKSHQIFISNEGRLGHSRGGETRSPLGGSADKGRRKGAKHAGSGMG